ncbi:MAG TPA: alpha/beta fold hydrolase [Anaerolineaceae bacterium]|nr:alpha/beta fold hydrolase [Anaerolineaceae bacterium]HPN50103.1 alpha/beta fold hydrolase [Anaerolineaceae bacterium]
MNWKKIFKWFGISLAALLILGAAGFILWGNTPLPPMPEALAALNSDQQVTITQGSSWTSFEPAAGSAAAGLIFYPGGRVDWRAYAPLAKALAAEGYLVVITPMPLNLAILSPERANEVMAAYPAVQSWVIGGHSLGGAMAAQFAYAHPEKVKGLALLAAYPTDSASLAQSSLKVVSISASNDGLATPAKIAASHQNLPPETRFVEIQGGNHAGFGWYGRQDGDGEASISREAQHTQTIAAILSLLSEFK